MGALIQCPHCKQLFGLSDQQVPQYAGQTISCSQCKQAFAVPANLSQQATPPFPPPEPSLEPQSIATAQPTAPQSSAAPDPEPSPQASAPTPTPPPPAQPVSQSQPAPARVEKPAVAAERTPVELPPIRLAPPPPRPARAPSAGSRHGAHPHDSHHGLHVPPPVYPGASAQAPRTPSIDYPAAGGTRPQAGINKLAVASVVCGAVGLIPIVIPSIVGLIVGVMGLRRSENPLVGGRKIALTGISISALSFVLVFGWLAIVIPQVSKRNEEANRVRCQANLKAIGQAMVAYTAQYGAYPPHLEELMISQNLRANLFVCPSSDDSEAPGTDVKTQAQTLSSGAHLSYMYVGQRLNTGMPAARIVVLYEPPANHDHAGSNFLFGDGHVDWLTSAQAEQAIPQIQNGINPPKY